MMPFSKTILHRQLMLYAGFVIVVTMLVFSGRAVSEHQAGLVLSLNGHALKVEIANSDATRMQGLAHRDALPEDCGMLFILPEPAVYSMWMRHTHIALSVAFLDEQGVIINIEDMEPDTLVRHSAARPAKFALEVNRGWFAAHGVKAGLRVDGIEHAPPAG
jgi:hypothetical protein